jgi:hypothetical protein
MKRVLLALGTAVLFLSTLVTPTAVRADGGSSTKCSNCKPQAAE